MKNLIALVTLGMSLNLFAAATTPMTAVEETAHLVDKYAKAGKIDSSYLNNITSIVVQSTPAGLQTIAYAPSANSAEANNIVISFDLQGRAKSLKQNFISAYPQGPIFVAADAATLFDLGAESVVDHLADNADLPNVNETATMVELTSDGANTVVMKIQLLSGKIYLVKMDQNGNVLAKGF